MAKEKVRWGVLGAGGFADHRTIPALKSAQNAVLQAVMEINLERAQALAEKHAAPEAYERVEMLLNSTQVDAVYVCTPVYLHSEHVLAAARAGKHIFCEKPMAESREECREMLRVCAQENVKLGIGYMMRYRSQCRIVKEYIDGGELGEIVYGRAQNTFWYPPQPNAWRQDPSFGSGGVLFDIGSHVVDTLRFLIGEVSAVKGLSSSAHFPYPADDTVISLLEFKNGASGMIDVSWAIPYREALLEIYGTRGSLIVERGLGPFTDPKMLLLNAEGRKEIPVPQEDAYRLEFEAMGQAILEDRAPEVSGREGLRITEILLAIQQSMAHGKPVKVDFSE